MPATTLDSTFVMPPTGHSIPQDEIIFGRMYQDPGSATLKCPEPLLSESNISLQSSLSLLDSMNSSDSEESVEAAVPCHLGLPEHSVFRSSNFEATKFETSYDEKRSSVEPLNLDSVISVKHEAGSGSSPILKHEDFVTAEPSRSASSGHDAASLSRQCSDKVSSTALDGVLPSGEVAPAPMKIPSTPISAGRMASAPTGTAMDLIPLPDLKPKRIRKTGRRQRRPVPYEKMTPEEVETEKVDRLEKNRQSARDCRRRKKGYIQSLEERLAAYEEREVCAQSEILQLRSISEGLLSELKDLKKRFGVH